MNPNTNANGNLFGHSSTSNHDFLDHNPFPNPINQHQHLTPPPLFPLIGNWQQGTIDPNVQLHAQQQQQQHMQQMQALLQNQIAQQQQQHVASGMLPFSLPFIPPQLIHEALSNSVPVEAADEPVLLTTLLNAKKNQVSYKDALNGLHGTNGHSASLWKDYYLHEKDKFDNWIDACVKKEEATKRSSTEPTPSLPNRNMSNPSSRPSLPGSSSKPLPLPTIKKPSPSSFKHEPSPPPIPRASTSSSTTKPIGRKRKKQVAPIPVIATGRSTMNSLSTPAPVFGARLPAPNADIKIPKPPSRSPSPPTNVIPQGRGNKYTAEDRDFFIKFIGWRLKQDPNLNRSDLCNLLAEKAPHHGVQSWASHWSNNHDLPDKILAAARGEEGDQSSEEERKPITTRPTYLELTSSDEDEADDDESSNAEDGGLIRRYSEKEMSENGSFNEADMYVTALHVASHSDWEACPSKERWQSFHEKHSSRSAKSWAEYYRRNEKEILRLAKKIKKERGSAYKQIARPTRIPTAKRKLEGGAIQANVKRGKID